ncbi:MAG: restriction endonuclease [Bacilli bacterium]|jgi:hypothetical protein|nr:restriction endonuclease [Bacilli bacterium]
MENDYGDIGTTDINKRIENQDREKYRLYIDRIYKDSKDGTPYQKDVVSKIFHVRNQGGFRFPAPKGEKEKPVYAYCVLASTGREIYWKDEADERFGVYVYYGDQNKPGFDILDTALRGNKLLSDVFGYASSNFAEDRKLVPPIFAFQKVGSTSDVIFKGLLVPGVDGMPTEDWLVAFYTKLHRSNISFLNFKALFTILDTSDGSEAEPNNCGISFAWLTDIENGNAYDSKFAPKAWRKYIDSGVRKAIKPFVPAEPYPSKELQLPMTEEGKKMLCYIHDYFIQIDNGYSFEPFATRIVKMMFPAITDIETTRSYDDGGVDSIGKYQVFKSSENTIKLDFYVQSKCYAMNHGVDTKDTSRLISRIKTRDFGLMFVTSYICKQAYDEIIKDKHPVGFITGGDIIYFLIQKLQIRDTEELKIWLSKEFPRSMYIK